MLSRKMCLLKHSVLWKLQEIKNVLLNNKLLSFISVSTVHQTRGVINMYSTHQQIVWE